jgi:hypothetical protein
MTTKNREFVINMSLKSSLELFLALLYANEAKAIKGSTRLVKMIFLLVKEEGFEKFEEELKFEAWKFGPWSSSISLDYPQTMENLNLLEITKTDDLEIDADSLLVADFQRKDQMSNYMLSEKGKDVAKVYYERLDTKEKEKLERLKKIWNEKTLSELLNYVYLRYDEYTKHSVVKDEILADRGISERLASLIGIIPYISLEEEKKKTRKIIREKQWNQYC